MNREHAYKMFEDMIVLAKKEIVDFTINHKFDVEEKADKTVVTACDKHIDKVLSQIAKINDIPVISEEGQQETEIVKTGNYLTIDPIDGSLGYIEHVNYALNNGDIKNFLSKDLGPQSDFCLLIGIVENAQPKYGCCYHYVTGEKIMLDASSPQDCQVELFHRKRNHENVCYIDPRAGEKIQESIVEQSDVETILQATLGLKSLYVFLNEHKNAVTIHRVQHAGLWDILPSAVASRAFGGILLDDEGDEVIYDKYIILPGKGATAIKGKRFISVQTQLRRILNLS